MTDLESRALAFATAAHASIDQRRKYTGESYIVHPIAVAEVVRSELKFTGHLGDRPA